jgi:hypothetical protein
MGQSRGIAAVAVCAAALGTAPAAQAAQGSDSVSRWDTISYAADPGEANRVLVEDWIDGGLHVNDPGAIIRWTTPLVPGLFQCAAVVHDVYCQGGYGFAVQFALRDGDDTYTATTDRAPGEIDLGPGDDHAVGGPFGQKIDGGPGADRISGGGSEPNLNGGPFPEVLTGGPGRDELRSDTGAPGDAFFDARDGEADRIWCGAGTDTVLADAQDVIETPGACEEVLIG